MTTRKFGTRMIVGGIISVAMMIRNTAFLRPRKRYFDSANAAIALKSSVISVATTVMNTLFQRKRTKSNWPKISRVVFRGDDGTRAPAPDRGC